MAHPEHHRAGYVAVVGRPNVGKSTLVNRILGQKVTITSTRPQTTRNRVVGIYNDEHTQALLVDTPGIHEAWTRLNRYMVRAALSTLNDVDLICWIVDAHRAHGRAQEGGPLVGKGEREILERVRAADAPLLLVLNKIDRVPHPFLLPLMEAWSGETEFQAIVPVSALEGDGVDSLVREVRESLPVHPPLFPKDQLADQSERFVAAEIIREKVFRLCRKEIPYHVAVEVEQFEEQDVTEGGDRGRVEIHARIIVARQSQKAIVIGKGGSMIKTIGTRARQDLRKLLGCPVHLALHVAVEENWTRNERLLRDLGYRHPG